MTGKVFISNNRVRVHDTDLAGILYFARQFRFCHDAWEEFIETSGYSFRDIIQLSKHLFVVVHAESDYYNSITAGDPLQVEVRVSHIGNTSFTMAYKIYREGELIGQAKIAHVCLNFKTRIKETIPDDFRKLLQEYIE